MVGFSVILAVGWTSMVRVGPVERSRGAGRRVLGRPRPEVVRLVVGEAVVGQASGGSARMRSSTVRKSFPRASGRACVVSLCGRIG